MTPDAIERDVTLQTASARLDDLRVRSAVTPLDDMATISTTEARDALALSEVLVRKAMQGRQLDVRAARRAGASWTQIGAACGVSKQAAWEAHERWISGQEDLNHADPDEGLGLG